FDHPLTDGDEVAFFPPGFDHPLTDGDEVAFFPPVTGG
ncbi:hypothetical protein EA223_21865, partial [Escherichia coli]